MGSRSFEKHASGDWERNHKQPITVTVTMYNAVAEGVVPKDDVGSAISELIDLQKDSKKLSEWLGIEGSPDGVVATGGSTALAGSDEPARGVAVWVVVLLVLLGVAVVGTAVVLVLCLVLAKKSSGSAVVVDTVPGGAFETAVDGGGAAMSAADGHGVGHPHQVVGDHAATTSEMPQGQFQQVQGYPIAAPSVVSV